MLHSTLDTMRRLLGACRGVPFSEPLPATPAANKVIYRLKTWPRLRDCERTAGIYRVLSVMSSRPVTRQWILDRGLLKAPQVDALLAMLAAEDAVEVIDPAEFAGRQPCRA